jgi:hypothetical protein
MATVRAFKIMYDKFKVNGIRSNETVPQKLIAKLYNFYIVRLPGSMIRNESCGKLCNCYIIRLPESVIRSETCDELCNCYIIRLPGSMIRSESCGKMYNYYIITLPGSRIMRESSGKLYNCYITALPGSMNRSESVGEGIISRFLPVRAISSLQIDIRLYFQVYVVSSYLAMNLYLNNSHFLL